MTEGDVGLGSRLLKGVEVNDDHVDGQDAVLCNGGLMVSVAALIEQTAVDFGVEGLYASVEHFREAGEVADVFDLEAGFAESAGGAAG